MLDWILPLTAGVGVSALITAAASFLQQHLSRRKFAQQASDEGWGLVKEVNRREERREIERVVNALVDSNVTEATVETGNFRIVIKTNKVGHKTVTRGAVKPTSAAKPR